MKKLTKSDILFTALAVVLLIAFAAAVTWPTLTDAAYEAHMALLW